MVARHQRKEVEMAYFYANRSVDMLNVTHPTPIDAMIVTPDQYDGVHGALITLYDTGQVDALVGYGVTYDPTTDTFGGTLDGYAAWDSIDSPTTAYEVYMNLPVQTAVDALAADNLWPTV